MNVYKICRVCLTEFSRWKKEYKLLVILLLLYLYLDRYNGMIFYVAEQLEYPVTPWAFPLLMAAPRVRLVVYIGAILYFSNVSSEHPFGRYQLLRCGRTNYLFGKMLYIMLASLLYIGAVILLVIVPHVNQIYWSADWGKVLGSCSYQKAIRDFYTGSSRNNWQYVIEFYTPASAMGYSILLTWMSLCMIGLCMFFINSVKGKVYGILAGSVLVTADFLTEMISKTWLRGYLSFCSPITWSNLAYLRNNGKIWLERFPSLAYGLAAGGIVIFLLMLLIWICMWVSYRTGSRHNAFRLMV